MVELIKPEFELKLDSKLLTRAVVRLIKQDISERFKQTREVTDEDWEFCEQIDWHPVDELELKEEYVEKLKKIADGPHIPMDLEELDKLMGLK